MTRADLEILDDRLKALREDLVAQGAKMKALESSLVQVVERVSSMEEFALSMGDLLRQLDDDSEQPDPFEDPSIAELRKNWRIAHDAARARRARYRG